VQLKSSPSHYETMENIMEITDRVVLITGASGGIGLATAHLFAQNGAKLALAARSAEKLAHIASELPDAIAITTDMRDEQAIQHMIAQTQKHYGRIDVLINNAGQGMHVPIEKANLEQYRSIFELNVVSVLAAMQAVIPIMRAQGGGVIVNISSGTSKMVIPGVGPYASTKYALNSITLTARKELAADNIRVGLVHPGITATDFHTNLANGQLPGGQGSSNQAARIMQPDTAEYVATKILEAVQTEADEVYAESVKGFLASR
jgi:NADP-dependent 3-hydroxy acid dehydrogenase YdfG